MRLEEWAAIASDVAPDVVALVYAPSEGVPAQAFLRPLDDDELATIVAEDILQRLHDLARGEDVFQSYDQVNDRKVAIIYGRPAP